MVKLPIVSGKEAVKAFLKAGWYVDRTRGSHTVMLKPGHIASLSIPQHKELSPGTLRSLIRASEMTVEEFSKLLK